MKIFKNTNGITIKQLKDLVKDLPEKNINGEDYEVWIESDDGSHSNVAKEIWPLNKREEGQDIIIKI